jgi:hypothetical protein
MRWLPKSIPYLIVGIALYFTCYFGIEAFRVLTSPVYGLDHAGFASVVHGIGGRMALQADGLMRLAAFFGAVKLSIAVLFATYLVSRIRSLFDDETEHEIVDAAIVLIATVTVVAAMPALFDGATDPLAEHRLPLWLAGLAATLSMIERVAADESKLERTASAYRRYAIYNVVLPPKRNSVCTLRWDALRRSANVNALSRATIRRRRIFRLPR